MNGEDRRTAILKQLSTTDKPISASRFAKKFAVSRQIIVGDVALLRAAGTAIIATARGYRLENAANGITRKLACLHRPEQTEEELMLIVENGGEILDVAVDHPIYGEIVGSLHIKNSKDVKAFMKSYEEKGAAMLSILTGGVHLHTIRCQEVSALEKVEAILAEKGFLYKGND